MPPGIRNQRRRKTLQIRERNRVAAAGPGVHGGVDRGFLHLRRHGALGAGLDLRSNLLRDHACAGRDCAPAQF